MIKNKTILITGGSTGIGYHLYLKLKNNNKVYIMSRNKEKIKNKNIDEKCYFECDVTDYDNVKKIIGKIINKENGIDILILNAGIGLNQSIDNYDAQSIDYTIKVNFISQIYALGNVLEQMKAQKSGIIVSLSSIADSRGLPNSPAYSASKAALTTFMEGMELNLSRYGINVLIVRPGFIKTPLTEDSKNPMPFIISAEKAANIIIKGIEKKKKRVEFPFPMVLLTNIIHCLPSTIYRKIIKIWFRNKM